MLHTFAKIFIRKQGRKSEIKNVSKYEYNIKLTTTVLQNVHTVELPNIRYTIFILEISAYHPPTTTAHNESDGIVEAR